MCWVLHAYLNVHLNIQSISGEERIRYFILHLFYYAAVHQVCTRFTAALSESPSGCYISNFMMCSLCHHITQLTGNLDDCTCDAETIDTFNNEQLFPKLQNLLEADYFRFYKVKWANRQHTLRQKYNCCFAEDMCRGLSRWIWISHVRSGRTAISVVWGTVLCSPALLWVSRHLSVSAQRETTHLSHSCLLFISLILNSEFIQLTSDFTGVSIFLL